MDQYYQRQISLKEVGQEGQQKLTNANVLVIGAGGLGCPVLEYLTAAGVGHIHICDYDRVELTNLHRQVLYSPDDIGEYKAEVAANILRIKNPLIHITSSNIAFDKNFNIEPYTLIIDCSDNFETKFLAHDLCYQLKKCYIQASIHKFEGQIQVFDYQKENAHEGPCLRCLWAQAPSKSCVQTCEEVGVLGAVPGIIGTIQAMEAIKLILGLDTLANAQTLIVNLLQFSSQKIRWPKADNCPLCSETQTSSYSFYDDAEIEVAIDNSQIKNSILISLDNCDMKKLPTAAGQIFTTLDKLTQDCGHLDKTSPLTIVCKYGTTSIHAALQLKELGHSTVYSLKGGAGNL